MSAAFPKNRENVLLAQLPRAEYQRLQPQLEPVALAHRSVLYEPGDAVRHVYFPRSGAVSMLADLTEGQSIELTSLGREGMVGLRAFLGETITPFRFLVQAPGEALRLEAEFLQVESQRQGPLHQLLCRYTSAFLMQLAQLAACNGLHTVKQRCCRWLLLMQDRIRADAFPLTQDFWARMLGVRRASVADVARALQRDGLIRYRRGVVTILHRAGLERSSCECYRLVRREYSQQFGDA
ncbi:MAG: Crp/Fnr family transcriptional regulator [Planctomycetia bacterium]|nr:Crp/Fnr family transcriptional regulator [Planctomycetia bacterium]